MTEHATFVRLDSARALRMTLTDGGGAPIVLTGAAVVLRWRPVEGGDVTETAATIVSATAGMVEVVFAADAFAADVRWYSAEWRVTFSGGTILTVPSEAEFTFEVREPLA